MNPAQLLQPLTKSVTPFSGVLMDCMGAWLTLIFTQ